MAAWNLERCLFPEETAEHLRATGADVVLLSEMDNGMARTGQRHPTAELAGMLGMTYAYGIEFIELGLGSDTELEFCNDVFNDKGFHGNALMASAALANPFMIRLWGDRLVVHRWRRTAAHRRALRRSAPSSRPSLVPSSPFPSISKAPPRRAYRERQMQELIDRIEAAFPGLPILIGGDLNTGNHAEGDFEAEGLFADERSARLYPPWRPDRPDDDAPEPDHPLAGARHEARLVSVARPVIGRSTIIPSLDANGRPLSDHDLITCVIEGFE